MEGRNKQGVKKPLKSFEIHPAQLYFTQASFFVFESLP